MYFKNSPKTTTFRLKIGKHDNQKRIRKQILDFPFNCEAISALSSLLQTRFYLSFLPSHSSTSCEGRACPSEKESTGMDTGKKRTIIPAYFCWHERAAAGRLILISGLAPGTHSWLGYSVPLKRSLSTSRELQIPRPRDFPTTSAIGGSNIKGRNPNFWTNQGGA